MANLAGDLQPTLLPWQAMLTSSATCGGTRKVALELHHIVREGVFIHSYHLSLLNFVLAFSKIKNKIIQLNLKCNILKTSTNSHFSISTFNKMAGLLNNKDQKNTQDSVTDGATGVAKTGTGSTYY